MVPLTKHAAQAEEPRRGQKIGSFAGKRAQILDYRRRHSERSWQLGYKGIGQISTFMS